MGQQQSSEKPSTSRSGTLSSEKDRRQNGKVVGQTLSHSRGPPADPSASNTTAVAEATTSHTVGTSELQHLLQSTSPDVSHKANRPERSNSRAYRGRTETEHNRTVPVQQPASLQIPESAPSTGIDIPVSAASAIPRNNKIDDTQEDYLAYQEKHYAPVSKLRPPRLPLPIADAPIPDSPTLMPVDQGVADVPIFDNDESVSDSIEAPMRRRSSFQSEATQEEEEIGDELQPYATEPADHTVPTTIEWNQPGERVFVTGTFATWERKYRLHRRRSREGMSCTINLPPGTHHLKFWVDSQMVTSPDLPTAVDFNNVLVNYIEISADDIPKSRRESSQTATHNQTYAGQTATLRENQDEYSPGAATPGDDAVSVEEPVKEEMPPGDYRSIIPQYLIDIEYPEDDPKYRQAADIIQDGNGPPSLPMFLNRSILNGNTPVKDDNSVLPLPNYTVLNHLMTSSVKNGVLATSVTHRYKKKVSVHSPIETARSWAEQF